jgi:hypothetical protein
MVLIKTYNFLTYIYNEIGIFVECLATESFFGSGPLTDIAVWKNGRYVN